ncbi:hypothetical protein HELRODRAFT_160761 [Helobdella robusta]|uniref:Apple domain-containing protein n=1 Tax=Helobdella robusta TaxID=6412 RepID=T1EQP6_HELRO|nr:hypothetical protein HELRODRAFT_160761 [Helobdella robusta]ESO06578.1 hypothetical protein HELRODRAFT_160761 [Helobdella robusta]
MSPKNIFMLNYFINVVLASTSCFEKLKDGERFVCSSDHPTDEVIISQSLFPAEKALMLCLIRCSQTSSCVVNNFFTTSNRCQLFDSVAKTSSVVAGCQNFVKKRKDSGQRSLFVENENAVNRTLLITVDDWLIEFYVNGISVPIQTYFPNAQNFKKVDSYELSGHVSVLAIKSRSPRGAGLLLFYNILEFFIRIAVINIHCEKNSTNITSLL